MARIMESSDHFRLREDPMVGEVHYVGHNGKIVHLEAVPSRGCTIDRSQARYRDEVTSCVIVVPDRGADGA
jgi:hypothetical protein